MGLLCSCKNILNEQYDWMFFKILFTLSFGAASSLGSLTLMFLTRKAISKAFNFFIILFK